MLKDHRSLFEELLEKPVFLVRQRVEASFLQEPARILGKLLAPALKPLSPAPAQRAIVAVGSRRIDKMPALLRAVGAALTERGFSVFVIPAMGSHGGGSPAGQAELLRRLGIGEERTGIPILSPSDYLEVGVHREGQKLYLPPEVLDSRFLVVINRIKLHTRFSGPIQSGLSKMLVFGLGGPQGAMAAHGAAEQDGLESTLRHGAAKLLQAAPPTIGVGIVENETHQIHRLAVTNGASFLETDRKLLCLAAKRHPRLPIPFGNLLIVERMGKEISGSGMDPHVIGRPPSDGSRGTFRRIFVRQLTEKSHGNALGIGLTDYALQSLCQNIDWPITHLNAQTSGVPEKVRLPDVHLTDRSAINKAFQGAESPTILQIQDTLHVAKALAIGYNVKELEELEIQENLGSFGFRTDGRLKHLLCGRENG